jgi:hypothetical protein
MNDSYLHFARMTERLVAPLVTHMLPGRTFFPIEGNASRHGQRADELEAFSRPGLLLALWLQAEPLPEENREHHFSRETVAEWMRQAICVGTDPHHPAFWGHMLNLHQHGAEFSILSMSLLIAREWLWDPLEQNERDQVAEWLGEMRGHGLHDNNHLFFFVLTIEFLRSVGYEEPGDQAAVESLMDRLERMHAGGGWFRDGSNQCFDHYNAYAFHTYGLWWVWKFGYTNPERAERWSRWGEQFLQDYVHFFAASGEPITYGRSMTYRFNGLSVFGLAPHVGLDAVPSGEMRRLCRKCLEFFLRHPITQAQGFLALGWTDPFPPMAEGYSCPASPYWAAKGLFLLTIPSDYSFWTAKEQPFPAEREDFARVVSAPSFLLRGLGGRVELLNAGSQIAPACAEAFGAWKWSKLSYRSEDGILIAGEDGQYPVDAQLTVKRLGFGMRYGRQFTIPLVCAPDHVAFSYALGDWRDGVDLNVIVRTDLFLHGNWILALHRVKTNHPAEFTQGSFSIGSDEVSLEKNVSGSSYARVSGRERSSAVQGLSGFSRVGWDERLDDSSPRMHLTKPYHVTPCLHGELHAGATVLSALLWSGEASEEGEACEVILAQAGFWKLRHPRAGEWEIENEILPPLTLC